MTQTGCIGLCQYEPIVEVMEPGKEKVTYVKMNPEKAMEMAKSMGASPEALKKMEAE